MYVATPSVDSTPEVYMMFEIGNCSSSELGEHSHGNIPEKRISGLELHHSRHTTRVTFGKHVELCRFRRSKVLDLHLRLRNVLPLGVAALHSVQIRVTFVELAPLRLDNVRGTVETTIYARE